MQHGNQFAFISNTNTNATTSGSKLQTSEPRIQGKISTIQFHFENELEQKDSQRGPHSKTYTQPMLIL